MNFALLLAHTLICLTAPNFLPVYGQSTCCDTDNCCDDGCNAPAPYNLSLAELVSKSPLYIQVFPAITTFAGTDNVCITYVPLGNGTYLGSYSTAFSNGFTTTESYILSQDDVGVYSIGSSTCVLQVRTFDYLEKDDCSLYLMYSCFKYGDCYLASGNDIPVFGLSSSITPISQDCLDAAIDRINRAGVPPQNYFKAPFEKNPACVTNKNC